MKTMVDAFIALLSYLMGGLHPIGSQFIMDFSLWLTFVAAVVSTYFDSSSSSRRTAHTHCTYSRYRGMSIAVGILLFLYVSTPCITARWTLVFPLILWMPLGGGLTLSIFSLRDDGNKDAQNKHGRKGQPKSRRIVTVAKVVYITASMLLLLSSAFFTILFPAVQLPLLLSRTEGHAHDKNYEVEVVDIYLEVPPPNNDDGAEINSIDPNADSNATPTTCPEEASWPVSSHVPVRIYVPIVKDGIKNNAFGHDDGYRKLMNSIAPHVANKNSNTVPYIEPNTAMEFCQQFMKIGGPTPWLREWGAWLLHSWQLIRLPLIRMDHVDGAQQRADYKPSSATDVSSFPLVIYSHGLVGTSAIYSYQTVKLAAQGYIVASLTHTDGSAPVAQLPVGGQHEKGDRHDSDGKNLLYYDHELPKLWFGGRTEEYVKIRRERAELRTRELIATAEFMQSVDDDDDGDNTNDKNSNAADANESMIRREWKRVASKIRGKIRTDRTTFMGHSFGGTTAITAALRRPDLAESVVAHEPALDWAPDDVRASLFSPDRIQGLENTFDGGSGGLNYKESSPADSNIHDKDLLFLFSDEWRKSGEAWNALLNEMRNKDRFGRRNGPSALHYIDQAHHTEFSDVSMLMPLWLSRASGLTGTRNPIETADEIHQRTLDFLRSVGT